MVAEFLGAQAQEVVASGLASALWVKVIGAVGQGFFAVRMIVQWLASERAHRPVAPVMFWYLSAAGAVLMSAYSVLRGEMVMVPGFVVTLLIYLRNVRIARRKASRSRSSPIYLVLLGIGLAVVPYAFGLLDTQGREAPSPPWLALAIVGHIFWIGRFVVQWHHAERHGKSEFPPAFWWLTIVGRACCRSTRCTASISS